MAEDYYSDAEVAPSSPAQPSPQEEKSDSQQTFLVPKSACPGMSPGDRINARIVGVHGEEYSCVYEPEEKEEMAEAPAPESMAAYE